MKSFPEVEVIKGRIFLDGKPMPYEGAIKRFDIISSPDRTEPEELVVRYIVDATPHEDIDE